MTDEEVRRRHELAKIRRQARKSRKGGSDKADNRDKFEFALDIIKAILQWAVVSVLGFLYWMFALLMISLFATGVWMVTFITLVKIGTVLAVITSVVYAIIIVRRRRREYR